MKKLKFISIMFAFLICSAVTRAENRFQAWYSVPVKNKALTNVAQFEISSIVFSDDSIVFKLPAEIASEQAYEVNFERSKFNSNLFVSAFGSAHCLESFSEDKNSVALNIKCNVKYNSIYQNFLERELPATERFLGSKGFSPDELEKRIDLARDFSTDPIGVLKIILNSYSTE